ncbi:HMA2 domain-containing protein [Azorhizophilus paspali]|uniref:HMA2 domain-containing protein n=1 Tax=Azorhizophilus paspali TaxID=69963 RepID=A0ABV6SUK8_AZOPA
MIPPFDELRDYLAHIRIVHHIHGRIRLKLVSGYESLAGRSRQARRFQSILDRTPGIHSVRVNPLARSCSVEYDPQVIPAEAWGDFLAGVDSPAAVALEQLLREIHGEIRHEEL